MQRDGSAVLKGTMVVDEVKPIKADSLAVVFIGTTTDEKGHAKGHNILARAPDAPTALAWLIATPEAKAIPLVVKKEEAPNEADEAGTRGTTTKLPAAAPHEAAPAAAEEPKYTPLDDALAAAAAAAEKSAAEGAWAAEGGAGEATTPLKLPALNLHPVVADLTAAATPRERRDSAAAA